MSENESDWEPEPPYGEDWSDHPDCEPPWDALMGRLRLRRRLDPTVIMWHMVLREGALGLKGEWEAGPLTVSCGRLADELGRPPGAGRSWEIRVGHSLRRLCPGIGHVRRRVPASEGGRLEYAYVLPSLGECRAVFAAWLACWETVVG